MLSIPLFSTNGCFYTRACLTNENYRWYPMFGMLRLTLPTNFYVFLIIICVFFQCSLHHGILCCYVIVFVHECRLIVMFMFTFNEHRSLASGYCCLENYVKYEMVVWPKYLNISNVTFKKWSRRNIMCLMDPSLNYETFLINSISSENI